jgi:hypothetical protein
LVPIPSLPTDNLYKFMAIAGSVCAVGSVVLLFLAEQGLIESLQLRSNEMFRLSEEGYQTVIEMNELIIVAASKIDDANQASEEAQKGKIEAAKQRMKLIENQIEEKRRIDSSVIKAKVADLNVFKWTCVMLCCIGLVISILGFRWWWKCVQLPHDEMLRIEVELMRRKLAPESTGIGI